MINRPRVAGVVVMYNSEETIFDNIKSYINQIETLFIIDNSEEPNQLLVSLLKAIPNIIYISNNCNEGIATALNQGAMAAIERGFDYLLTMDDDTQIPENMVDEMLLFIENNQYQQIGIIAPQSVPNFFKDSYRSVFIVITSGNLLNLNAYKECGPFLDKLFIDWVDHEYCIRLKKKGYLIYELNYLLINHRLGLQKNVSLLGLAIKWTSHSPIRLYYKTRNTLYVMHKYAFSIPLKIHLIFLYEFLKDLFKNIFLETSRKARIRFIIMAIIDYKNNKLGKLVYDRYN